MPVTYPPPFTLAARNARLVGYRTLLSPDGWFANDETLPAGADRDRYLGAIGQADPFPNEQTGLRPTADGTAFTFDQAGRTTFHLPGTTISLCSTEPSNYGSFLFRVLPKLHDALRHGPADAPVLAPLPAPQCRDLLALAGLPLSRIRPHDANAVYACDHVVVPALRNNQALLDPETLSLFADLRHRHAKPGGRRLYVSRAGHTARGASSRALVNEAELVAALRPLGFEVVEPETLPARAQIALFGSAALVVGPSGSAMFNTVFCQPGTRVIDIESEPWWIHAHLCLFGSLGLEVGVFVGAVDTTDTRRVHRRWRVNVDALLQRVRRFA